MAIFRFFKTAAAAILHFQILEILTVGQTASMCQILSKWSNRVRDMVIFRFSKMAATAILDFSNFVNFNNHKAQEGQTASPCQISSKSVICKNRQHCIESLIAMASQVIMQYHNEITMWANAQLMAALPDIGGALYSTPQSLADARY